MLLLEDMAGVQEQSQLPSLRRTVANKFIVDNNSLNGEAKPEDKCQLWLPEIRKYRESIKVPLKSMVTLQLTNPDSISHLIRQGISYSELLKKIVEAIPEPNEAYEIIAGRVGHHNNKLKLTLSDASTDKVLEEIFNVNDAIDGPEKNVGFSGVPVSDYSGQLPILNKSARGLDDYFQSVPNAGMLVLGPMYLDIGIPVQS